jgi:hypothetical protein
MSVQKFVIPFVGTFCMRALMNVCVAHACRYLQQGRLDAAMLDKLLDFVTGCSSWLTTDKWVPPRGSASRCARCFWLHAETQAPAPAFCELVVVAALNMRGTPALARRVRYYDVCAQVRCARLGRGVQRHPRRRHPAHRAGGGCGGSLHLLWVRVRVTAPTSLLPPPPPFVCSSTYVIEWCFDVLMVLHLPPTSQLCVAYDRVGAHCRLLARVVASCRFGILMAMGAGQAMTELLTTGEAKCIDLRPFNPCRRPGPAPATHSPSASAFLVV